LVRKVKTKIECWLTQAKQELATVSENSSLEAQILVSHVLQHSRSWVITHSDSEITASDENKLNILLERLASGEPLPYIIGRQEFFGLDFFVTPDVLIPRPETELLVETALNYINSNSNVRWVADIGTGSGCISVSVAFNAVSIKVLATDISSKALEIASKNITHHHLNHRILLAQTDLMAACHGKFDLLCANLPYIPTETLSKLQVDQHEPHLALEGGPDGLEIIARLMVDAPRFMVQGGLLLFEIESTLKAPVIELARGVFPHARVEVIPDLSDRPRLLSIQL
jgi:release factor glutamine methyltransferase